MLVAAAAFALAVLVHAWGIVECAVRSNLHRALIVGGAVLWGHEWASLPALVLVAGAIATFGHLYDASRMAQIIMELTDERDQARAHHTRQVEWAHREDTYRATITDLQTRVDGLQDTNARLSRTILDERAQHRDALEAARDDARSNAAVARYNHAEALRWRDIDANTLRREVELANSRCCRLEQNNGLHIAEILRLSAKLEALTLSEVCQ